MGADEQTRDTSPALDIMLSGASGQMGHAIAGLAAEDEQLRVVAHFDWDTGFVNQPIGNVIIDVSHHSQTPKVLAFAREHGLPIVIGTTALSAQTDQQIAEAADHIAICQASNFSLGATLLGQWLQQLAAQMPDAMVHISETHHLHKQDAPSGTALALQAAIEEVSSNRHDITIESHREGQVIGTHEVSFSTAGECVTLRHEARDRRIFAQGAVWAAQRLLTQQCGIWTLAALLALAAADAKH